MCDDVKRRQWRRPHSPLPISGFAWWWKPACPVIDAGEAEQANAVHGQGLSEH